MIDMLIELARIKKHLNLPSEFNEDDEYIEYLYLVAEKLVEKHVDRSFDNIIAEEGGLPEPLLHAMLLFIGNMYENRESVAYATPSEVPMTLQYILAAYRDYSNANI